MATITLREWPCICACGFQNKIRGWSNDFPFSCPDCGSPVELYAEERGSAPGIVTDDIPGGYTIRHGLVNADGSPRTFYSKSDIKRAANKAGLTISGDTPKPYKVQWDGLRERRPDERYDKPEN